MSKIKFKNCKVITEKKEENYAAFNVELESIKSLNLNGDNRQCEIIMKDGNVIKVHYYDDSVVL